jgi:hypothetical protein
MGNIIEFREDVRNKFNQEEFNQIKDYHMRIFETFTEPEEEPVKKVYILQSISQVCSVISAKIMIDYVEDASILDVWFKGIETIEADDFVSLDEGEVAICHDPKGGFYLIQPL